MTTTAANGFTRTRTTWAMYLMLAAYVTLPPLLSSSMPFLRQEMGLNYTLAGSYMSVFALGIITAGLSADWLARRIGRRIVFWGGGCGAVLGILLLIFGRYPAATLLGAFLMGSLGAQVQVMVQVILSDIYGKQRGVAFAESNLTGAISAALVPLLIGGLEGIGWGWRAGALVMGVMFAAIIAIFFRTPIPESEQSNQAAARPRLPWIFWLLWIVIYFSVGIEWGAIFWGPDFLEKVAGFPKAEAATLMSLFFIAIIFGRWITSRVARRVASLHILIMEFGLAIVGILMFWLVPVRELRLLGILVTGIGVSSLYPMTLAVALSQTPGAENTASARATLGAGVAIFSSPLIMGWAADQVGIRSAYGIVLAYALAALVITLVLTRLLHNQNKAGQE